MNRLNRLHAEQQEDCSSFWGQQLRSRGHQTESSSVLQEDSIYLSIEVVDTKQTNTYTCSSRAYTQARPHEASIECAISKWLQFQGITTIDRINLSANFSTLVQSSQVNGFVYFRTKHCIQQQALTKHLYKHNI